MILFILEGDRDASLLSAIKETFFSHISEPFVCIYKSNIYSLYSKIQEHDLLGSDGEVDTISVLNDILLQKGDTSLQDISPSQISEIYLFFDYDFQQSRGTLNENNTHLEQMLNFFDNETTYGKLYIHYPMLESIRYTKELPDDNYIHYTITRAQCKDFKDISANFSFYKSFDYLLKDNHSRYINWKYLIEINVKKANYLCNNEYNYPYNKEDITQINIFLSQIRDYVQTNDCQVSILNSFPLFLYEYLKEF